MLRVGAHALRRRGDEDDAHQNVRGAEAETRPHPPTAALTLLGAARLRGGAGRTHLSFEDFLEALCRVAGLLALPTDAEVAEGAHVHAGEYLAAMQRDEPEELAKFRLSRRGAWGVPTHSPKNRVAPHYQPVERCIDHTVQLMAGIMQKSGARYDDDSNIVSAKEACTFLGVRPPQK